MKLSVDGRVCQGHGRCYLFSPELLSDDDEGFVSIRGRTIEVPPDQEEAARIAEGTCPEGAISLSDEQ
jgi:ferredoxin